MHLNIAIRSTIDPKHKLRALSPTPQHPALPYVFAGQVERSSSSSCQIACRSQKLTLLPLGGRLGEITCSPRLELHSSIMQTSPNIVSPGYRADCRSPLIRLTQLTRAHR